MCSWCWGFSPVMEALRADYRQRLKIALVLGGLRPGSTAPMTPAERAEILRHWHDVQAMTGQPFRFADALPEGFAYDTEPPSRAVVTVAGLDAASTFPMFKAIQTAFYAEGRNVTRPEVLAELAADLGVDPQRFRSAFAADAARAKTLAHFQLARQLGVRGFPTLVLNRDQGYQILSSGWRTLEELRPQIESALQ